MTENLLLAGLVEVVVVEAVEEVVEVLEGSSALLVLVLDGEGAGSSLASMH